MKSFFSFLVDLFHFVLRLVCSLRPLNLFLIFLTQTLTSVFLLDNSLCTSNLFQSIHLNHCINFYFLVLATVLSAAAGYILNDSFDRKIDLINSPQRGLFTEKNLYLFYFLSSLFFGIALILGFLISFKIGFSVFLSVALLIFYAKYSKKIGIFKPISVSFLTAFSILLVGLLDSNSVPDTIYFFASWAFLLSINREVIKDFEDFEGDTIQNSFTSVIQLGKRKSILLLHCTSVFLVVSIIISVFFLKNDLYDSLHRILMIILIGIFLFLLNNQEVNSYKKLSLFCKLMMFVGILGMIVY